MISLNNIPQKGIGEILTPSPAAFPWKKENDLNPGQSK